MIEAQYAALVATLVARGIGVGVLDPFTASGSDGRGLAHVPFRLSILFEVAVLQPTQRPLSQAAPAGQAGASEGLVEVLARQAGLQ